MKKLIVLLSFLMISGSLFLTSCEDETTEPVGDPTINIVAASGFISTDATITVNEEFKVRVSAFMNAESGARLTSLKVTRLFTPSREITWDTTFVIDKEESLQYDFTFTASPLAGAEEISFLITDEKSRSDEASLTITTIPAGVEVQKYSNITLGSYNDPIGSFFASTTGTVMTVGEGTANPGVVDFAFFLGATNGPSIASPMDDQLITISEFAVVATWNPRNNTRLVTPAPITSDDFNSIGTNYEFPTFNDAGSVTLASQLGQNDVVYFKTVAGKLGFIKINTINARGDVVNIDVVVEK